MPNSLREALLQLAHDFAYGVVSAVRSASLKEFSGDSSAPVPAPRTRARAAEPPPRQLPVRAPQKPAVDRRATVDRDRLVYFVSKSPKGIRSEDLRKKLGLEKVRFREVAVSAVNTGLISQQGEKRATTYYPR